MHGFVIVMGVILKAYRKKTIIPPSTAREGSYARRYLLIHHANRRIKDKGKSDWLAKSLVLLQTSWFVLQRIGRTIEYLPVAHLEIMTLGYATMNFVVYMVEQAREHLRQLQDLAPGQRTDF